MAEHFHVQDLHCRTKGLLFCPTTRLGSLAGRAKQRIETSWCQSQRRLFIQCTRGHKHVKGVTTGAWNWLVAVPPFPPCPPPPHPPPFSLSLSLSLSVSLPLSLSLSVSLSLSLMLLERNTIIVISWKPRTVYIRCLWSVCGVVRSWGGGGGDGEGELVGGGGYWSQPAPGVPTISK